MNSMSEKVFWEYHKLRCEECSCTPAGVCKLCPLHGDDEPYEPMLQKRQLIIPGTETWRGGGTMRRRTP